jgi:tetratricopeptide (TPR) repeat protein
MKFFFIRIYILFCFFTIFIASSDTFAKDNQIKYTDNDISNYFIGVLSSKNEDNEKAFKYLKKVKSLKNNHTQFNIEYIRTLVLLDKFQEAFTFSESIWEEDELFFSADLLIGLNYFLKKDYEKANKFFYRLNSVSRYNIYFKDFIGNILLAWSSASQGNEEESFNFTKKIPKQYSNLKNIQEVFLKCYFNNNETKKSFEDLIGTKGYNFSRYNFFLINYLIHNNNVKEAKKIVKNLPQKNNSTLLMTETKNLIIKNENDKIRNFFNCKNPKDSISEFFYVISNLYASEKEYRLSNFYLKISLFLNDKFLTNKTLLAENFYYQKKNNLSKNIYLSLKEIGPHYSWYAAKNIATILSETKGKKESIDSIVNDFNLLKEPDFLNYYDLANFYKDNGYYLESIEYYSLALKKIKKDHILVSKILDRRGTSYEKINDWEKAEKDLLESLKISPDQAHVLNYLAYTWVDKGINLDKGLAMLKKALKLKENDVYITDSVGWAYYAKKNYKEAEIFLQRAVELLPSDPIINDHYADTLWMLNKKIQARYFWNYVLNLDDINNDLKEVISKKLIFGIKNKI